jgi:WD40 repeat protein/tRNA A-37 threonylcarbamoyl transferase component Bud32
MADQELIADLLQGLEERHDLRRYSSISELLDVDPELRQQVAATPGLEQELERGLEALRQMDLCIGREAADDASQWPDIPGLEVQGELGCGGMGVVYKARQARLNRTVAVKVMLTRSRGRAIAQRFRVEAEAVARLTHPNIAQIFETGEHDRASYLVLEYMAGGNLAKRLRGVPQSERWSAEVVRTIALAVHYAHSQGIVHRDLKPTNILIAGDGTLKIADFGLAKLLDAEADLTRSGDALGTPSYMAPEQARGIVSPQADIYALGAILYELLTGRPPFVAETSAETLVLVQTREPIAPGLARAKLSGDLQAICLKCLEKDVRNRYATAEALAEDLGRFLAGKPTLARPLSKPQRAVRWARRQPALAGLIVFAVASLLTMVSGAIAYTIQLNRALTSAEENSQRAEQGEALAKQEEARANTQLYPVQMRMAKLALDKGEHERAAEFLSKYAEGGAQANLRSFEWYLLQTMTNRMANQGANNSTVSFQHPDELYWVEFAPNAKHIVTGCKDGRFRIWNFESKQLLHEVMAHGNCVNQVRYSPDGRYLATASCDNSVKLWELTSDQKWQLNAELLAGAAPMRCVAWSRDSKQLASGGDDGFLRIWEVESCKETMSMQADGDPVGSIAWSINDAFLGASNRLYGYKCGHVWIWDTKSWRVHSRFTEVNASRIEFSPNGRVGAVFSHERGGNVIRKFDLKTGGPTIPLDLFGPKGSLAWSGDGRQIATVGNNGTLRILNSDDGTVKTIVDAHQGKGVEEIAFSPDSRYVAMEDRDGVATVTDLAAHGELVHKVSFPFQTDWRNTSDLLALDEDLRRLTLYRKDRLEVWDVTTGTQVDRFELATDQAIKSVNMSSNGKHAVLIRAESTSVVDIKQHMVRRIPAELATGITHARISDEAGLMLLVGQAHDARGAIAEGQYSLHLVDMQTLEERKRLDAIPGDHRGIWTEFSPTGRHALVMGIWPMGYIDFRTGERRELKIGVVNPNFSQDGLLISHGELGARLEVCDVERIEKQYELQNSFQGWGHVLSPDGRTIAIADDKRISLCNTTTGQEIMTLSLPVALNWQDLRFSRDSRRLAILGIDGEQAQVFIWDTAKADSVEN